MTRDNKENVLQNECSVRNQSSNSLEMGKIRKEAPFTPPANNHEVNTPASFNLKICLVDRLPTTKELRAIKSFLVGKIEKAVLAKEKVTQL